MPDQFRQVAVCFCCLVAASPPVVAQVGPSMSTLTVVIDEDAYASAKISIANPHLVPKASSTPKRSVETFLAVVPFERKQEWQISTASDVRTAVLSSGPGYAMLSVLAPRDLECIPILIRKCQKLGETHEGKSKLEFDVSYPFASRAERDILSAPSTIAIWDITVILPRKHEETEVSFFPPKELTRVDGQRYTLSAETIQEKKLNSVWIVFPNPVRQSFRLAKLVFSLIVGTFSALFHWPALRSRRFSWLLIAFLLSLLVLLSAGYFWLVLAKGFDLVVFAALSLPHAVFCFLACLYLLLARKYEACVTGRVTIDGEEVEFVDVRLLKLVPGKEARAVARIQQLHRGVYRFFQWVHRGQGTFLVTARAKGTDDGTSCAFGISSGERMTVPVINLTTRPERPS